MRRALLQLWRKEWLHHRWSLAVLFSLLGAFFALQIVGLSASGQMLSTLQAVQGFVAFLGPAVALYLGHRLVVTETYGHTQLFVESLPVPRGAMEAVKYLFGLLVLWLMGAVALGVGLWLAAEREPIGGRFIAILAAKTLVYLWVVWSAAFAVGFLGRLRVPFMIAAVVLTILLDRSTAWDMGAFGPLALVDSETFAFERHALPMRALWESCVLALVLLLSGFGLARGREGSLVELLARPMSQREKSAAVVLALAGTVAFAGLEPDALVQPYRFESEAVAKSAEPVVEIMYGEAAHAAEAKRWRDRLGTLVRSLAQSFVWSSVPALRVALDEGLRPDEHETVRMDETSGVVLRGDFRRPSVGDPHRLTALALHQLFVLRSNGRVGLEPEHWVLDGFSRYWSTWVHPDGRRAPEDERAELKALAVVAAEQVPIRPETIAAWDRLTERLGEPLAAQVAEAGLVMLEKLQGPTAPITLGQAILNRRGYNDVRDWWSSRAEPMDEVFAEVTGMSWGRFVERWAEGVASWRDEPSVRAVLQNLGRVRVSADLFRHPDGSRQLTIRAKTSSPRMAPETCTVRHRALPPYDAPFPRDGMHERDVLWPVGKEEITITLAGVYGAGERFYVALDCYEATVNTPIRWSSQRLTMP